MAALAVCGALLAGCGGDDSGAAQGFKPFAVGEKLTLTDVTRTQNITLVRTAGGFKIEGAGGQNAAQNGGENRANSAQNQAQNNPNSNLAQTPAPDAILFDIFATFCPPCKKEAPHLMDFANKNAHAFKLIGLITFEEVADEFVVENFIKQFGAYYFIANSAQNERLIWQILRDIGYNERLQIPFKVVLKGGQYQLLRDNLDNATRAAGSVRDQKFWLGAITTEQIARDFGEIFGKINF